MRRLFKEESIYKTEVKDAAARVEKLKADKVDDADIRNAVSVIGRRGQVVNQAIRPLFPKQREAGRVDMQERVVKDAEQMIPRTRQALDEAVVALEDLVVSFAPQHPGHAATAHLADATDGSRV
jgi:cobalamin biosynthesis protein CbiD